MLNDVLRSKQPVVFKIQEEVEVETQPPPKTIELLTRTLRKFARACYGQACGGVANGDIQRGGRY